MSFKAVGSLIVAVLVSILVISSVETVDLGERVLVKI